MWKRALILLSVVAVATPAYADDRAIANIADGIASYRLSAQFCHWPIPSNLDDVLKSDELHFRMKNPRAFASGEKVSAERFHFLTTSLTDYCDEVKDARERMTDDLRSRAK